jgi:hypothetical protein
MMDKYIEVTFNKLNIGDIFYRRLTNSYYEKSEPFYAHGYLQNARALGNADVIYVYDTARVLVKPETYERVKDNG